MRLDRLTVKAQEAFQTAQRHAESKKHQQLDAEHLAWALVRQDDGVVPPLLKKVGVDVTGLRRDLDRALDRLPQVECTRSQIAEVITHPRTISRYICRRQGLLPFDRSAVEGAWTGPQNCAP